MIEHRLLWNKRYFVPHLYRGQVNTGAVFAPEIVDAIAKEAFKNHQWLYWSRRMILPKMFDAGLCTGMSAWVLLKFAQQETNYEEIYQSAIMQARILLPQAFSQIMADCALMPIRLLMRLKYHFDVMDFRQFALLMIIPQLCNVHQLARAHTLVPYRIISQEHIHQIFVYDCNYPDEEDRKIILDELSGTWRYDHFSSKDWYWSILPLATFYF